MHKGPHAAVAMHAKLFYAYAERQQLKFNLIFTFSVGLKHLHSVLLSFFFCCNFVAILSCEFECGFQASSCSSHQASLSQTKNT
mmetsp:Transcript_121613/g.210388  ORF Transcript_121613/g.210388 Transcript_121613/m.210388 type:complete len:84 (+) Transcript_121613:101-352(+)